MYVLMYVYMTTLRHRKPHISISHTDIGDKLCLKYASCFFYGHYCIYVLYIMMCVMYFPIMNRAGWIWSAKSTATESCLPRCG